jgi:alanyl-tRNA synthetase
MRRAIRHGKRLGLERLFLADVCEAVMEEMGGAYPETRENRAFITKVAAQEEESFRRTLDKGLAILEAEMRKLTAPETHLGKPATPPPERARPVIEGKLAFQLYDTFGFPLDLTRVIAAERGFDVDEQGFDRNMAEQRAAPSGRAPASRPPAISTSRSRPSSGRPTSSATRRPPRAPR